MPSLMRWNQCKQTSKQTNKQTNTHSWWVLPTLFLSGSPSSQLVKSQADPSSQRKGPSTWNNVKKKISGQLFSHLQYSMVGILEQVSFVRCVKLHKLHWIAWVTLACVKQHSKVDQPRTKIEITEPSEMDVALWCFKWKAGWIYLVGGRYR